MTDLQVFKFNDKPIRTVLIDDQPWWVAKDVAETIGYAVSNITTICSHVPMEWKGSKRIATPGGEQEMVCLSEHGLYFFLARSDKEKASIRDTFANVRGQPLPNAEVMVNRQMMPEEVK